MKLNLRFRGGYCPNRTRPIYLIIYTIFLLTVGGKGAFAQTPQGIPENITPLAIGDTIPEWLWHLPLEVVNHPDGKDTITLDDYRGKLILLDFLSTACSGCIRSLPRLQEETDAFGSDAVIFPVTAEGMDRVKAFSNANEYLKGFRMPIIVGDRVLKAHFPHAYVSHVVWLDGRGAVRAATNANHVNAWTLGQLGCSGPLDWPVKAEHTDFFHAPLVTTDSRSDAMPNNRARVLSYAAITGYTEGVGHFVATAADSLAGMERLSYRNRPILDLYLIALDQLHRLRPHQILLKVSRPDAYDASRVALTGLTMDQWYQRHAICYERTFPLGTPAPVKRAAMLADLDGLLNLHGRMERRDGERRFILSEKTPHENPSPKS